MPPKVTRQQFSDLPGAGPAFDTLARAGAADAADLDATSAAVVALDPGGRISGASVPAASLLGYLPRDLCGRTLGDLALDGWREAADVAAARVRFGATESFELALRGRSGRRTLVEMTPYRRRDGASCAWWISWCERRARRLSGPAADDAWQQRVAYDFLRSHEEERRRVSDQLHDEIGSMAVMAKYLIEDAVSRLGDEARPDAVKALNQAVDGMRNIITELHRISTELRPRLLDDLGLFPALEWLSRRVEERARHLQLARHFPIDESEVSEGLKLDVFRIVQAALENVVQHARARSAQVSIFRTDAGELCVMIEDDGLGFDAAASGAPAARDEPGLPLGLVAIRRRIEATGGRFFLESRGAARGTRVGGTWPRAVRTS